MSDNLSEETLTLLRLCSAATLTTALFKRGFRNTWINGVDRLTSAGGPMVGPAYTLRYIPAGKISITWASSRIASTRNEKPWRTYRQDVCW